MATPKKPNRSKAILNLLLLIPTIFNVVGKITALLEIEARLAGQGLIRIIILAVVFGALLTATWGCVLALLFSYLQSLLWSPLAILSIILLLNILLLIIIGSTLSKAKKDLLFPEIRHQLRSICRIFKDES